MKTSKLAAVMAGSLTLILIVGLGAFVLRPRQTFASANAATAVKTAPVTANPDETTLATQTGQTQAAQRVDQINQLLQERKATYQGQLDELASRVQTGQAQLKNLAVQEQMLRQQLAQLQAARGQRHAQYQQQLQSAQSELAQHREQYDAQLQEAQAKQAEANALLGR